MIDDFNAAHPNVVVSKDSGGVNSDRMLQKVTAGLQADNYPDIAYIYGSDLANLAGSEQLLDLSDARRQRRAQLGPFFERPRRRRSTVDEQPRAVPAFIDNLAVVYNKKIFDDGGGRYPTDDWTWDDFLATAAELNDPDAGIAGFGWPGTGDEDTTWRIWPLDLAAGRRHRRRGRHRASASTARAARRRSRSSRRRPPTSRSTSTAPPAASACSSCSPAARWR